MLLHPISHVMPLFVIDRAQWRDWRTYTRSTRPTRAFAKMWRAALEVAGLRKRDLLFEEAFAIRLGRELQPVIEQHPVITAHRAPFSRPVATVDRASVGLITGESRVSAGRSLSLRVEVANTGTSVWETSPGGGEIVRVGVQLLTADGDVINRDYSRHALPQSIVPGGSCEVTIAIDAPATSGAYALKIDLVREGRGWFELSGSQSVVHHVRVG